MLNLKWKHMIYLQLFLCINLYEDISNRKVPTAEIEYDIKSNTNQKVTAKLVNPSTEITITNKQRIRYLCIYRKW